MKKWFQGTEIFYLIIVILVGYTSVVYGNDSNEIPSPYQSLIDRLSQDGFDAAFLNKLFADPRAAPIPSLMTISLDSKETKAFYAQFLKRKPILLGKYFLRYNLKGLRQMEKRFNVEKEVVVAILLVESRLGENIGNFRVIPTLSSITMMDSPDNLQKYYLILKEIDPSLSYEDIERLAKRRANWAYHELKCFLEITRDEKIDPLEIFGSPSGALGMAQFIPSSYMAYAESKKGFEYWLLSKEEAIQSIGNYLKSYGWRRNLPVGKKKQILWYYNRSHPYVETVLQLAQKIKY